MITIDELFAEDFKPQWMIEKERLVTESIRDALTTEIDYKWNQMAEETVRRISSKYRKVK